MIPDFDEKQEGRIFLGFWGWRRPEKINPAKRLARIVFFVEIRNHKITYIYILLILNKIIYIGHFFVLFPPCRSNDRTDAGINLCENWSENLLIGIESGDFFAIAYMPALPKVRRICTLTCRLTRKTKYIRNRRRLQAKRPNEKCSQEPSLQKSWFSVLRRL